MLTTEQNSALATLLRWSVSIWQIADRDAKPGQSLCFFGGRICAPREAARRKFTPEFVNRLDKIVVFKPLGTEELRRIVDIEVEMVQQRIQTAAASKPFLVNITDSAREFLLMEGTDFRYDARPLKRAIERHLVQPLSNLMATGQIHRGDRIRVNYREGSASLMFFREVGALEAREVAAGAAGVAARYESTSWLSAREHIAGLGSQRSGLPS